MKILKSICLAIILPASSLAQSDTTVCGSLLTGWNLVSIPVYASDRSAMTNFGVPYVFEYIVEPWIGYRSVDTLEVGQCYWIRSDSTRPICFSGRSRLVDTVDVRAGWNFVGSLSATFSPDTTALRVIPSGAARILSFPPCEFFPPCVVTPGLGFIAFITSDAPNPRLVIMAK